MRRRIGIGRSSRTVNSEEFVDLAPADQQYYRIFSQLKRIKLGDIDLAVLCGGVTSDRGAARSVSGIDSAGTDKYCEICCGGVWI